MDSTPFNWSLVAQIMDEAFGIPTDVTFHILEGDQTEEVKTHKIILGIVSPVFKTMFFTTNVGDKAAKEIKIKETTKEAFQIMIDAIYSTRSIEVSLKEKSVEDIFDVVDLLERYQVLDLLEEVKKNLSNRMKSMSLPEIFVLLDLVEKYQFPELLEAAKKHFANFPLTDDTLVDVAADAFAYTGQFQDEAQNLLQNCAKFLDAKLKDVLSILRFVSKNENHKEVVNTLLARIYKIPCPNCNYGKENCQNGKVIKPEEFRNGIMVTNNKDATSYWGSSDYGTGKVTNVSATQVTVMTIKNGITQNGLTGKLFSGGTWNKLGKYGVNNFLFSCN